MQSGCGVQQEHWQRHPSSGGNSDGGSQVAAAAAPPPRTIMQRCSNAAWEARRPGGRDTGLVQGSIPWSILARWLWTHCYKSPLRR
jgi:hypothetical protein